MQIKRRYTSQENQIIIDCIKECPANLAEAFRVASTKLVNRSADGITTYWHTSLKKNPSVHALVLGSSSGFTQNTKNISRVNGNMPEQGLQNYMLVMKSLLDLPPKERKVIVEFFAMSLK